MLLQPFALPYGGLVASYNSIGAGVDSSATTISYTDTIPSGSNIVSVIWALSNNVGDTSVATASIGGKAASMHTVASVTRDNGLCLHGFVVFAPPSGSQIVSVINANNAYPSEMVAVHYQNVVSVGNIQVLSVQPTSPATSSMSVPNSDANAMYANAFCYQVPGAEGFSAYTQTQRLNHAAPGVPGDQPMVCGDAQGNGGTLTFSVTRASTTYNWAGIIIPLQYI